MTWEHLTYFGLGVALTFVTCLIVINVLEARRERDVRENGVIVLGWIVQANVALYEENDLSAPAQVLICFEEVEDLPGLLDKVAKRIGKLKSGRAKTVGEKQVAKLVRDEKDRPHRRHLLPTSFSDGPNVYSAHVWVVRQLLPEGKITLPYVVCKAVPGNKGLVIMVPYPDEKLVGSM